MFVNNVFLMTLLFFSFFLFFSVGVHVLVEDVNEFAPLWNIRSDEKSSSEEEPVHTLATNVAIEEGQLLEEVRKKIFAPGVASAWPCLVVQATLADPTIYINFCTI